MYDVSYLVNMSKSDILAEPEESRREVLLSHMDSIVTYRVGEEVLFDYCDIFLNCSIPFTRKEINVFLGLCDVIASRGGFDNFKKVSKVLTGKDTVTNMKFKWKAVTKDNGLLRTCVLRVAECYKYRSIPHFKALVYAYLSSHGTPLKVLSDFFYDSDKIKQKDIPLYTDTFVRYDWCPDAFMALVMSGYTFSKFIPLVDKMKCTSGEFPYCEVPERLIRQKIAPYKMMLKNLPEVPSDYVVPIEFFR